LRVPVWYEIVMWGISEQRAGLRGRGQSWSSIMWRSNRCKWWASRHGMLAKPLLIESHTVAWVVAVMWVAASSDGFVRLRVVVACEGWSGGE